MIEQKTTTPDYVQYNDTTGSSITTIPYFFGNIEVKCPYSGKCTDFKKRCDSCKHNERRSFYEPDYPYRDYYPWYPYYPHYPYYPWSGPYYTTTTACDTGDDLTMPTISYHEHIA